MGASHEWGKGVEQDYTKAAIWYERAAGQGYMVAQYNLGLCYRYGRGYPKDINKAVELFRIAAEKGHPGAQNALGEYYAQSEATVKNIIEAYALYSLAAPRSEIARQNLDAFRKKISKVETEFGEIRAEELKRIIESKQTGK